MKVRQIETSETEQFLCIARENEIYFEEVEHLMSYDCQKKAKFWFAVSSSGDVLGMCCSVIFKNRVLISALATTDERCHAVRVYQELLNFILNREQCATFDVVFPSMYTVSPIRGCNEIRYKICYDIDLYSVSVEKIRQQTVTVRSKYKISTIRGENLMIWVSYWTRKGEKKTIVMDVPNHKTQYNYLLGLERCVVGFGALFKVNENKWVIGPLIAHNVKGAKFLLNEILSDAKRIVIKEQVFIYTLNNNPEAGNLLDGAGFVRSGRQWTIYRYSQVPGFNSEESLQNDGERIYFGINSIAFSIFLEPAQPFA